MNGRGNCATDLRVGDWFEREPGKADQVQDLVRSPGDLRIRLYLKFGGNHELNSDDVIVRTEAP